MCTIPLLIVLSALSPGHDPADFGQQLGRYLHLGATATNQLHNVFAGPGQVRAATTLTGLSLLLIYTLGVAAAHQRAYELAWQLPKPSRRNWARQTGWVAGLTGYLAALAATERLLRHTPAAHPTLAATTALLSTGFFCWTQHLLLAGRITWPRLLPGAAIAAATLTGYLAASPWYLSTQITSNVTQYGPIGVTFALATWQLLLSTLHITAITIGAALDHHTSPARPPRDCRRAASETRNGR